MVQPVEQRAVKASAGYQDLLEQISLGKIKHHAAKIALWQDKNQDRYRKLCLTG